MRKLLLLIPLIVCCFSTVFVIANKNDAIGDYPFTDISASISDEEADKIKRTLSACADIMHFDYNDYDYDRLFKYVLYTHKNFQILTDIPSNTSNSSSMPHHNVTIASGEYIDYIMTDIFRISPQKPQMEELLSRGFCYNNGYYYYIGGFDIYFATEINSLKRIYNMGNGIFYVVFSDVYRENDLATNETSFAVLQKNTSGNYSLLRIGMGEKLLSADEVKKYTPIEMFNDIDWKLDGEPRYDTAEKIDILFPVLALIIFSAIVAVAIAIKHK